MKLKYSFKKKFPWIWNTPPPFVTHQPPGMSLSFFMLLKSGNPRYITVIQFHIPNCIII